MKILENKDNKFAFQLAVSASVFAVVMFFPFKILATSIIETARFGIVEGYIAGVVVSLVNFVLMAKDIKQFVNKKNGAKSLKAKNFLRYFTFFIILVVLLKRVTINVVGLAGGIVLFQFGIFAGALFMNKLNQKKESKS